MKSLIIIVLFSIGFTFNQFAQNLKPRSGASIGIDNVVIGIVAPNNDIWLGSVTDGCAHFVDATNTWKFFNKDSARTNLKSNVVTGIEAFSNNKSLCATSNGAVTTSSGTWPELTEIIGQNVLATASKLDTAWLVTSNKLFRYKYDGTSSFSNQINKSIIFPGTVSVLASTSSGCGGFWGGTASNGCFYVAKDTITSILNSTAPKSLVDNQVNDLAVESGCSNIFIGTNGGFSVCPSDATTACQNYTISNGLPQNYIVQVEIGCGGNVWIATKDSGVLVFNIASKQFKRITKSNGLTDDRVKILKISPNCNAVAFTADRNVNIVDSGRNVIKVLTNIQESLKDHYLVTLYPNPASNNVRFDFSKEFKLVQVEIYDLTGKLVSEKSGRNAQYMEFELGQMKKGIYFYKINTGDTELNSGKLEIR